MLAALLACITGGAVGGAACATAFGLRWWRRAEQHLAHLADRDPLTGLVNRRVLDRVDPGAGQRLWVAYLDVDRFKLVNDHHGHAAGDRFLQVVATLLCTAVRPGDLVARVGGDEFVLILRDCGEVEAVGVVTRVQQRLSGGVHGCTLSAGLCEVPSPSSHRRLVPLGCVVHAADEALGEAKRLGRGAVVVAPQPSGRLGGRS